MARWPGWGRRPFPQDLLINIFSRLGVKQLFQLKCLSKEWLHTIPSPLFKKQHGDQSKKRPTLCLMSYSGSNYSQLIHLSSINSSNIELQVNESIAEFGDGYFHCSPRLELLCFYRIGYLGRGCLYNPITNKTLPFWFCWLGTLGYVSSTNEYKIVVSFERSLPGAAWEPYAYFEDFLHFKILTVKLDEELSVEELSWRDLLSRTEYSGTYHQPIHINGFVFWLLYAEDNSNIYFETGNSSDRMDILEMNLENEEIKTICCPNGCSFGYSHLAEINGTYMCYSE